VVVLGVGMFAGTAGTGKANLCEEAFDLLEAFLDLARVKGGEVVEGEGEEGLHGGRWVGVWSAAKSDTLDAMMAELYAWLRGECLFRHSTARATRSVVEATRKPQSHQRGQ